MDLRQDSFAGGEIAPEFWGRTSLHRYQTGLRRCRNFIPSRGGAAVSRPGTEYIGTLLFPDTKVRLVPYYYSAGAVVTPYLLEFSDLNLRAWQNGALFAGNPGTTPAVTVWTAAELAQLSWAQEGNTLTICHPNHPPYELRSDGSVFSSFSAVSFARPTMGGTGPKWIGNDANYVNGPSYPRPDANHTAKEWTWLVTQLEKDADGNILESAPSPVDLSSLFPAYIAPPTKLFYSKGDFVSYSGGYFVSLVDSNTSAPPGVYSAIGNPITGYSGNSWGAVDPLAPPLPIYPDSTIGFVVESAGVSVMGGTAFAYRFYRGTKGGPMGWVGDSGSVWGTTLATSFTDVGDDPDYSVAPPQGLNPFVRSGVTENPAAVGYFQGRRVFGGTSTRPHTLFASATAEYSNFDKAVVPVADDALVFSLASGRGEQIRSLTNLSELIALTSATAWAVSGGQEPLAFNNIEAVPQSAIGASWLPGIPAGDKALLYVRDGGSGVRALKFSWERQGYADQDISFIAQHLVRGHSIVDWAYAPERWGLVWMVREDGVLLSLTLASEEQEEEEGILQSGPTRIKQLAYAWAWHNTAAGSLPGIGAAFESVCVLRENGEDVVYLAVNRPTQAVPHGLVTNHRYLEKLSSRTLTLDGNGNPLVVDAYALDCATTYSGAPTTSLTGLTQLEGRTVYAVADGNVLGPLTVAADGSLALGLLTDDAASVVHVGLAFTPELELLDIAVQNAEVRARQKTLVALAFEVDESRGLLVGPDSDNLIAWRQRQVSDSYGAIGYASDLVRVPVRASWGVHARAFLRQDQPLPITVTGIVREVQVGG